MKPPTTLACLASLMMVLAACHPADSPSPLQFTGYESNPILGPGEPGSWDEEMVLVPCVVKEEGTFYLFYTGMNKPGRMAIGLAVSPDGYHFTKYAGNPVFTPVNHGFDSFLVGQSIVLKGSSGWIMYYSSAETAVFGPGPFIGRATATELRGPWIRKETPVLTHGSLGEWDSDFVTPCSIVKLDDGSYIMYYTGGAAFTIHADDYTGMATSEDGITWKKYNDPATTDHPFAESDPVLMTGGFNDWDGMIAWGGPVFEVPEGFEMYYLGATRPGQSSDNDMICGFGYATSRDGVHWEKYRKNPVFTNKNDPFTSGKSTCLQGPWLLFQDTTCFMYYDFASIIGKIGVATAIGRRQ